MPLIGNYWNISNWKVKQPIDVIFVTKILCNITHLIMSSMFELVAMATMNRLIILFLTAIPIWNKNLKFKLIKQVNLCLANIYIKFQVDTSILSWVLFNKLTSICSIWQPPWNHSTNIFIRNFFSLHRIHWKIFQRFSSQIDLSSNAIFSAETGRLKFGFIINIRTIPFQQM